MRDSLKRWLYLHLTWMGREERCMAREFDRRRGTALEALRNSPAYTCAHERREPQDVEVTTTRNLSRYEYYDAERCLDCGAGVVRVRRR